MEDRLHTLPITLPHNKASYYYMQSSGPIRFVASSIFAIAGLISAQTPPNTPPTPTPAASTLPPTAPTSASAQPLPPATPAVPLTPAQEQPKHAQVTLANGILSVTADNSSLNQILRQISHETGIKITGGVVDERVFGKYGPDAPSQILAQLLDGTGSNMLLVARDGATPAELILTPRQGGPTPPSPNAQAFDDKSEADDAQPASDPPTSSAEPPSPRNSTVPPITPAAPASTTPADTSQPDSPNGVKTPQQIYEQLQRLRQQQAPPQ
ncbi:hypothetical protein RBB79_05855 [Tunturiibacter empetritectus]|uniref:Uncharacterized protein n=2 Tax=Tunturiibacter TaxID=3154218 RepID=A0A852VCP6_9BACT|nr:hypothetical protein [Edaphobacter lichenicola]NYF89051.1 hypothetical protein [Edaphobacter lichenicola]